MSIVMSVNAGSSSLKFQVFSMPEEKVLAKGLVERIGLPDSIFSITVDGKKTETVCDIQSGCGYADQSPDRQGCREKPR